MLTPPSVFFFSLSSPTGLSPVWENTIVLTSMWFGVSAYSRKNFDLFSQLHISQLHAFPLFPRR
jgi:hypothetical protein